MHVPKEQANGLIEQEDCLRGSKYGRGGPGDGSRRPEGGPALWSFPDSNTGTSSGVITPISR